MYWDLNSWEISGSNWVAGINRRGYGAELGHVNKIFEQDFVKRKYIVPVCDTCNKRYKETKAGKIFFVPKAYLCYVP